MLTYPNAQQCINPDSERRVDVITRIKTETLYEVDPSVMQKVVNATLLVRINQNTIEQMFDNLELILESDD